MTGSPWWSLAISGQLFGFFKTWQHAGTSFWVGYSSLLQRACPSPEPSVSAFRFSCQSFPWTPHDVFSHHRCPWVIGHTRPDGQWQDCLYHSLGLLLSPSLSGPLKAGSIYAPGTWSQHWSTILRYTASISPVTHQAPLLSGAMYKLKLFFTLEGTFWHPQTMWPLHFFHWYGVPLNLCMIYLHALVCINLTQASSVLLAHLVQLARYRCSVDHCDVLLGMQVK